MARQFEEAGWKANARVGDPAVQTDLTALSQWGVGQAVSQLKDSERISSNMTSYIGDAHRELLRETSSGDAVSRGSVEESRTSARNSGLNSLAKADIAKTVKDIGHTIGNDLAGKQLFLAALNNDQTALNSFVKLNDAARTDQERQALQDLRNKVKGMSPEEMKVFKEHLLNEGVHGNATMDTLGKVGVATGLLAAISSAIYFAQQQRQNKAAFAHKVPVFSAD